MKGTVLVSDIVTYLRCPRQIYFRYRDGRRDRREVDKKYLYHRILKELALTYPRSAESEDVVEMLHTEMDRIVNEIPLVYRGELHDIDRSMILDAATDIDIDEIGSRIAHAIGMLGRRDLLRMITPCAVEYTMYSDTLGIAGSPDKLVRLENAVLPHIIKTGDMPDNGVWKPDRLQITAYAMLVEERFDQVVEYGVVEYARFFEMRKVVIMSRDRRRILELRNRIGMIRDGRLPDRPRDAPCSYCTFEENCSTQRSLASKFF